MRPPKIVSVSVVDDHTLMVQFGNSQQKKYDVLPLLERKMFAPLGNPALFRAVRVEPGGYALSWGDAIDISEYELWRHGIPVD